MRFLSHLLNFADGSASPACDLTVRILSGKGLPKMDVVGHCDAYVIITVGRGPETVTYKTAVAYRSANPQWTCEEMELHNVYHDCPFEVQVYDKDLITADDFVGRCKESMALYKTLGAPGQWISHELLLKSKHGRSRGSITLQLLWRPSAGPAGPLLYRGPARYRIAMSQLAGALMSTPDANTCGAYAAYKIHLAAVRQFFPAGDAQVWNQSYVKAQQIFKSRMVMSGVRSQHALLYADTGKQEHVGLLRSGQEFLQLLNYGVRGGELRYYTYVLLGDTLRFSETGAAFLADMMSKHAMHSGCAEKVTLAGEFCIVPSADQQSHILVVDNNSGTYAPPESLLPALRDLLCFNFPGLVAQYVGAADPALKQYHALVPSR